MLNMHGFMCMQKACTVGIILCLAMQSYCFKLFNMQVITQPVFATVKSLIYNRFGKNLYIHTVFCVRIGGVNWAKLTLFKLIWLCHHM